MEHEFREKVPYKNKLKVYILLGIYLFIFGQLRTFLFECLTYNDKLVLYF